MIAKSFPYSKSSKFLSLGFVLSSLAWLSLGRSFYLWLAGNLLGYSWVYSRRYAIRGGEATRLRFYNVLWWMILMPLASLHTLGMSFESSMIMGAVEFTAFIAFTLLICFAVFSELAGWLKRRQ